ncbi:MAG: adenylate/guanylate cyclase domain-containing response regulator [Leptospiraceae bacterium]|nr:adenylate/guanylate cyclase domain-containing response regulator [Leptospiraceae bacterium]
MTHKPKVLVVEDTVSTAKTIDRWLKQAGFDPKLVYSAEEAILVLESFAPDIAIFDHYLPEKTGIELLSELSLKSQINFPMLIMSAENSEQLMTEAMDKGASDFISKPINKVEMLLRLNNHLRLKFNEVALKKALEKINREKSLLAKYFSDDLVENILNETIKPNLGGATLDATILFFDIRGSTKISNQMNAKEFSEFLSLILTDIMDLIYGCNGSVNKLMGDGILATFGCPIPNDEDATNAVLCGKKILEYLETFNEFSPNGFEEPIRVGIGISSGKVFAGNIGSVRRMEYTVLGEAVNLASRLENLTKLTEFQILIDSKTIKLVNSNEFCFQKTKIDNVRGISETVEIYTFK